MVEFLDVPVHVQPEDFQQRVAAAAVKLGLVEENELDEEETEDLVELAADGQIQEPRSPLGRYLVRHWERCRSSRRIPRLLATQTRVSRSVARPPRQGRVARGRVGRRGRGVRVPRPERRTRSSRARAGAFLARSSSTAAEEANMVEPWSMKGELFGPCNCDWGCPCNSDAPPTYGYCEGIYVYHVREGRYGDTSARRRAQARPAGRTPGPVHEGNMTSVLIIDESASPQQRDALETLWRSGRGRAAVRHLERCRPRPGSTRSSHRSSSSSPASTLASASEAASSVRSRSRASRTPSPATQRSSTSTSRLASRRREASWG